VLPVPVVIAAPALSPILTLSLPSSNPILPTTSSLAAGLVVPIPTFCEGLILSVVPPPVFKNIAPPVGTSITAFSPLDANKYKLSNESLPRKCESPNLIFPETSNFSAGLVVPIPTSPELSIASRYAAFC
jgi:hypothetical protein